MRERNTHRVGNSATAFNDFLISLFCVDVPFPRIFKRHDLGSSTGAVLLSEQNVVVLTAGERWVKVHKVNRFVPDVATQHVWIVAVVKLVFWHCH